MCNVTISAEDLLTRSGLASGEIKSSPGMAGPVFCWFRYCLLGTLILPSLSCPHRFVPSPDQRVELHMYRILRVGQQLGGRGR